MVSYILSREELADFIIDPDDGDTRLHVSAFHGDLSALLELLTSPDILKNIDRRVRPFGATPLRLAATGGHIECMETLLIHGASVDAADIKAQTPLFVAVQKHNVEGVKLLLDAGADPNGDDGNRCTPLYIAARDGFLDGVKLLADHGAETELEARLGDAIIPGLPIHACIIYHHLECYQALLLMGAETDFRRINLSLPPEVLGQLSLAHYIVRHQCPVMFAVLFIEFGGYLWQKDSKGRLVSEIEPDGESKTYFCQKMGEPLSLLSCSRIRIRQLLGRNRLRQISHLPLPVHLQKTLHYADLIPNYEDFLPY